ncbi:hypothetical protein O181_029004 [Austropuccinia psidii MF-1]|uniref:Integrase catalytic domain-containing protein n=1 Tax=Austropuccinia psidii MF-1 TaxID=1389203 RepID=A0A9Q3CRN5_9BASI|nr:hypothetical protein [Austropuccinia psidii MF-1]
MFHSKNVFTSLVKNTKLPVTMGDSSSNLMPKGIGTVNLLSNNQHLTFPNLNCNLVSLLKLFDKELIINRHEDSFSLTTEGKVLLHGKIENNLMKVDYHLPTANRTVLNDYPWNERLRHVGESVIKSMGLSSTATACKVCALNKAHRLPFKDHFEPAHLPLDCVHIDLVGPISPPSISGCKYILTIVDQATSFKIVCFLKNKSDAFHHFSPAYTPEHNGFAERANRTILEKTRCMLNATNLPNSYWAETVSTANLLSNSVPTPSRHNHLPHTLWTGLPPRIKKLRVFGCQAIVMTPKEHQDSKLGPTGVEGILLGYQNNSSAYRVLCLSNRKILISRHPLPEHQPSPNLTPDTQELVDEPQVPVNQDESTTVDETRLADDPAPTCPESEPNRRPIRIKVIGPRHPTLVSSAINPDNILSYPR